MEELTGKQLGPYQIVDRLGEGGMATVFKAYQPSMDRYLALKVMARHFSDNPEFVSRFSQEARLIGKLEHPHILPVYDFGEAEGYTYLAMRLVEGGSLSDLLKKHRKLDLTRTSRIISQAGGALEYAHEKGVIHRDLKPGNVLIDEFGNCLLTDFGIAKLMETTSHLTHTGGILGTPAYIAPEQGSGKTIDSRIDIYSLGIVLYEMTVGDVPYKADTPMAVIFKHIHDPLPLPRQRVPDFPESIELVILKALAKNPDDRYSTASEFVTALQCAIDRSVVRVESEQEIVHISGSQFTKNEPNLKEEEDVEEISNEPNLKEREADEETSKANAAWLKKIKILRKMKLIYYTSRWLGILLITIGGLFFLSSVFSSISTNRPWWGMVVVLLFIALLIIFPGIYVVRKAEQMRSKFPDIGVYVEPKKK